MRGRTIALLLGSVAAIATGGASAADGEQFAAESLITLARAASPNRYDIWTIAPNGTMARRVTRSCMWDWWPDWSPDRRSIVFSRSCGGTFRLYVVRSDGSGLRAVTPPRLNAQWPTWSPDGRRIAFAGGRFDREDIYVVNVNGTGLRRLTANAVADRSPDWSPDGRTILFTRSRARGASDMMLVSPSSDGAARPLGVRGGEPAWSPDGRRIAFALRNRAFTRETVDIWIVQADGRFARRVTDERAGFVSHHPAWSPDGKQIAFMSHRFEGGRGASIYVTGAGGVHRVAKSPLEDVDPAWAAP